MAKYQTFPMLFATEMHENEHATHHTTWLASNAVKWLIEFLYQSVDLRSGPEPLVRQKDSLRWQGASGAIHVLVAGDAAQRRIRRACTLSTLAQLRWISTRCRRVGDK